MKCPHCEGTGEVTSTVGTLIAAARSAAGLTQEVLAARTGMGRGTLANIERDRQSLSTAKLIDIAKALGVTAGSLIP